MEGEGSDGCERFGVVIGGGWGRNQAFVTPTDFGSHSMLHQTLIASSSTVFPFSTSSSSFLPLALCPLQSPAQVDSSQDKRMEGALKSSLRSESLAPSGQQQQQQHQGLLADDPAWAALEKGSLLGEMFSVDDLLDLGGFAEPEKETEEKPEAGAEPMEAEENFNSLSSSSSSALSYEPPLSSEIHLPMSPLPLMAHDAEELEWVSLIIDDSLSEFPPSCSGVMPPFLPPPPKPQAESPPENRPAPPLSRTVCALSTEAVVPVKAKRSKRSRSAGVVWSRSGPPPFADSSSSTTTTTTTSSSSSCSSSSSSLESYFIYHPTAAGEYNLLLDDVPPPPPAPLSKKQKSKKRGRKPKLPQAASATAPGGGERRCTHCGVQKTPQWRAGPLGAKTLCNACGVRYKSGRLLPEYRPACSPTFVSNVHSNSHRKVLEMRRKKETELVAVAAPPVPSF